MREDDEPSQECKLQEEAEVGVWETEEYMVRDEEVRLEQKKENKSEQEREFRQNWSKRVL